MRQLQNCNCPGDGKPEQRFHAPNCPYRTGGYESREEQMIGDSLWRWLKAPASDVRCEDEK